MRSVAPEGSITEEGIARLRARIGIAEPHPVPPHYASPGVDAFRHVAEAYGDDNPLWWDDKYASGTRWGGIVAPPPLVGGDSLIGFDEVTEVADDRRELMKGYHDGQKKRNDQEANAAQPRQPLTYAGIGVHV